MSLHTRWIAARPVQAWVMPARHAVEVPAWLVVTRRRRVLLLSLLVAGTATGCGGHGATAHGPAATATSSRSPAPARPAVALHVTHAAALPAPVQLPGLARTSDGRVVAVGGL